MVVVERVLEEELALELDGASAGLGCGEAGGDTRRWDR
jgi:hypothetical protein